MDGENVSATFFGPFNKEDAPYIRIATGDFGILFISTLGSNIR